MNGECIEDCTPDCAGKKCGADGCGGNCGICPDGTYCDNDECIGECLPKCAKKECGDNGCGGVCGTCADDQTCSDGQCLSLMSCAQGIDCLFLCSMPFDACWENCVGEIAYGEQVRFLDLFDCVMEFCKDVPGGRFDIGCFENAVASVCMNIYNECIDCKPDCGGKQCGPDGCGGSCGICPDGTYCEDFQCKETCVPQCFGKECGTDGCGGVCGTCPGGAVCSDGKCECVPDCTGKVCGSDGCGGSCGTCTVGTICVEGQCVEPLLTDDFVAVPDGTFWMGSPQGTNCPSGYPSNCADESSLNWNEDLHYVKLNNPFEMQVHEVTQGEYETVMGWNPSNIGPNAACGKTCPVDWLSWYDSAAYANEKSKTAVPPLTPCYVFSDVECLDYTTPGSNYMACMNAFQRGINSALVILNGVEKSYECTGYRLPTESEWEYAARAGSNTAFYPSNGNDGTIADEECNDSNLDQIGWYCGNNNYGPKPVGGKEPNAWGLRDMSGNVNEWVWDCYFHEYPGSTYSNPDEDPIVPVLKGWAKVLRGGHWSTDAQFCRSASRSAMGEHSRTNFTGFRLCRSL